MINVNGYKFTHSISYPVDWRFRRLFLVDNKIIINNIKKAEDGFAYYSNNLKFKHDEHGYLYISEINKLNNIYKRTTCNFKKIPCTLINNTLIIYEDFHIDYD